MGAISAADFKNGFISNVANSIASDMVTSDASAAASNHFTSAVLQSSSDFNNKKTPNIGAGTKLSAADTYNAVIAVMQKLTSVRKFSHQVYFDTNGTYALQSSNEGKAFFQDSINTASAKNTLAAKDANIKDVQVNTAAANQGFSGVGNPFVAGAVARDGDRGKFFSSLLSRWNDYYNNRIDYKIYTCHSNCHSNCHDSCHSRGRR